jgi:Family of unknown function (DUF6812)
MDIPEIMIFTQTEVLIGSIFISTLEGRLLDELNGRISLGPENRERFLSLTNVVIQHIDGQQEKATLVHINKETIQMAATFHVNVGRGIGGQSGPKPYPFAEKVSVPVQIMMSAYEIIGNMYRVSHQKIEHVLTEKTLFVPLTDVVVIALANRKKWNIPFLAVNKGQILSLYEQSTATN